MYVMNYNIKIGDYTLKTLDSVAIEKSVNNLADTAVIVIPYTNINQPILVEDKIKEGDKVEISLGYNNNLSIEFKGYLNAITTDSTAIKLECEDGLYMFKKSLKDKEFKSVTLKDLLNAVVTEVNETNKENGTPTNYTVTCDYEFTWNCFVFFQTTAFDVLKKVQDETKANIYFKDEVLHIHPQYTEIGNDKPIIYDFSQNVEKSDLKYIPLKNKKIEVVVNATMPDGKVTKATYETTGGEKKEVNISTTDTVSMKKRAEQEYNLFAYEGYEGGFTTWLIPYCDPAYKIELRGNQHSVKNGTYYVISVNVNFSSSGGERVIKIGRRLG